jgi:hypothetical protein
MFALTMKVVCDFVDLVLPLNLFSIRSSKVKENNQACPAANIHNGSCLRTSQRQFFFRTGCRPETTGKRLQRMKNNEN